MRIEDSYLIESKWSYIIDMQGLAMKYYIKPCSRIIDVSDPKQMNTEYLKKNLLECMA